MLFKLAIRFIVKFHKNDISFIIIFISILSVSMSFFILSISLGIINGFNKEFNNKILSVVPHIDIKLDNCLNQELENIIKEINLNSEIIQVIPYIDIYGILNYKNKVYPLKIKCIEINSEIMNLFNFKHTNICPKNNNKIIFGKGIVENLNIKYGDYIQLFISLSHDDYNSTLNNHKVLKLQFQNVFSINNQIDYNFAIIPISDAQKYLERSNLDGISIKTKNALDIKKLKKLGNKIILNNNIKNISFWFDSYGYIYKDIKMIKNIIYISTIVIILISFLSMINSIFSIFKAQIKELAILFSIGLSIKNIKEILLHCSIIINIIGILIGFFAFIITSHNLEIITKSLEKILKIKFFSKSIDFADHITIEINKNDIIIITMLIILINCILINYILKKKNLERIKKLLR